MKRNLKAVAYVGGALLLILFIWNFSYPSYRTAPSQSGTGLLITGLIVGAIIMFLIWRLMAKNTTQVISESSHTIVESLRKVFKIVTAEGQFNELYNYEESKKIFGIIPSTKRALVIINAKVLMGFDFEKCVWETNEENHTIRLVSFPEPQILSIEPDYKYYNFDEGILNLVNRNDLSLIQANGKKQVEISAMKSGLPRIAKEQMRTVLTEIIESKNWRLEDSHKITGTLNIQKASSSG